MKRKLFLSLLFVIYGLISLGQPHPLLVSFKGVKTENGVQLNWTFKGGSQCEGTKIFRSTDRMQFAEIGDIPGVCGAPDSEISYVFLDENPIVNASNYYRLELGNQGYTEIVSVEFKSFNSDGYLLSPNPVQSSAVVCFENPTFDQFRFLLFNVSGIQVVDVEGNTDRISISADHLQSGLYFFSVSFSDKRKIIGKLLIQK